MEDYLTSSGASFGAARRKAFAERARKRKAKETPTPTKKSGPVKIRRVQPTVPPGTRAKRAPRGPVSFEQRPTITTAERMKEDMFPKIQPESEGRARHGGDPEPEYKTPSEIRAKARAEMAERADERKSDLARLRVESRTPPGQARERLAAKRGIESPLRKAERIEANITAEQETARKNAYIKSAKRQIAAGVRTPVVTTDAREERSKRVERTKRGMLGEPLKPSEKPTSSAPKTPMSREAVARNVWHSRYGAISPFAGRYPNQDKTISKIEQSNIKAGKARTRTPRGGALGIASMFASDLALLGMAAVRKDIKVSDVWDFMNNKGKYAPQGPMG